MTVTGGFPAPGPQDRDQPREGWYSAPPPTGPAAALPHLPLLTAHKPGIVPLRPLALGDILDGAIKAVRFNPRSMVGLSAIVLAFFLVPSAALGVRANSLGATPLGKLGPGAELFLGLPAAVVQGVFTTLATAILSGLLIHVVGQAVLGRKPDISETWQATRGRLPSLLALMVLAGLVSLLSMAALLGPGTLLVLDDNLGAGVALLVLGSLGLLAFSLTFSTKISLAAPAIVLEGRGPVAGLRRSFALTRGAAFWRVLGITLLAGLLAGLVSSLLSFPFGMAGGIIVEVTGQGDDSGQMIMTFVSHLAALLTGAITTPFVAAVTGLLYIDRRMRLEALDVVLLREAQTNPAPRI